MTYVITEGCIDIMDRSCIQQCPVDCIHPGARMLYIDPDECIDCGACASVCPQDAIFFEDELPPAKEEFQTINADFFGPSGPGIGADDPRIAALPDKGDRLT